MEAGKVSEKRLLFWSVYFRFILVSWITLVNGIGIVQMLKAMRTKNALPSRQNLSHAFHVHLQASTHRLSFEGLCEGSWATSTSHARCDPVQLLAEGIARPPLANDFASNFLHNEC